MPLFRLTEYREVYDEYLIEADSEEDAREKYQNCCEDFDVIDSTTKESEIMSIDEE